MSLRFFDAYVPSVSSGRHHHLLRFAWRRRMCRLCWPLPLSVPPATVTEKDPRSFGRPREWPAWHRPMTARGEKFVRARDQTWRNEIGDPRSSSRSKQIITPKATVPPTVPLLSPLPPPRRLITQRQGERGAKLLLWGEPRRAASCWWSVAGAAASVFGTARERTACASPRSPSLSPPPL
jgi:hypothetical protein